MSPVDVYVDVLFLINLGMDALCLVMAARLLHRSLSMLRLWSAAAVGGLYGVLALFLEIPPLPAWLIDIAVCFLMCLLAMGRHKLWLTGGIYVLSSMVMGGVMTALYHWLNRAGMAAFLPGGEEGVSSVAFVILAGGGWLITLLWGRIFRKAESRRNTHVRVTVHFNGATVSVDGMIDSGNLLTDPISGTPVIAVRKERILSLLSQSLCLILQKSPLPAEALTELPEAARLRLIPANTATGQGLLLAILPDEVWIKAEDERQAPRRVNALISPVPLEGAEAEAMVPSSLLV